MANPIKTVRIVNPDGDGYLTINFDDFNPDVHKLHGTKAERAAAEKDAHANAATVAGAEANTDPNPPTRDPERAGEQPTPQPIVDSGFNVGRLVDTPDGPRKPANLAEAEALKRVSDPATAQAKDILDKAAKNDTSIVDMSAPDATEWAATQTDKAALKKALHAEEKNERYVGGRKAVVAALTTKIDSL